KRQELFPGNVTGAERNRMRSPFCGPAPRKGDFLKEKRSGKRKIWQKKASFLWGWIKCSLCKGIVPGKWENNKFALFFFGKMVYN
ncbi:MAG: hypothetical protein IIV90_05920, partial [Oscillospiraceae bacterium]|nr:hypothetical protein [Oscillospiraceae bacterium]